MLPGRVSGSGVPPPHPALEGPTVRRIDLRSRVLRVSVALALSLGCAGAQRLTTPEHVVAGVCGPFDAEAHPDPDTGNAALFVALEDTVLQVPAPGVLANDVCVGQVDDINRFNESGGSYVIFDSGAMTYTPVANGYGEAHVDYTFDSLDFGLSNVARVTMTVIPVNDAPILYQTETGCGAIIIPEDSGAQTTSPCGWFAVPGGRYEDAQTFTPHTSTDHPASFAAGPTLTLNAGLTPGYVTFTPKANANGLVIIELWVTDSGGTANGGANTSNKHSVYVTLTPVVDAPVAAPDAYSTAFGTPLVRSAAQGVLNNDTNYDGGSLTAEVVTGPAHGVLALQSSGGFTYTVADGYSGSDSFTYRARNAGGTGTDDATVQLTILQPGATAPPATPKASPAASAPAPTTPPASSAAATATPSAGASPAGPTAGAGSSPAASALASGDASAPSTPSHDPGSSGGSSDAPGSTAPTATGLDPVGSGGSSVPWALLIAGAVAVVALAFGASRLISRRNVPPA
jgi:hypothetical protein